jgi:hypothetical protein
MEKRMLELFDVGGGDVGEEGVQWVRLEDVFVRVAAYTVKGVCG